MTVAWALALAYLHSGHVTGNPTAGMDLMRLTVQVGAIITINSNNNK